MKRIPATGPAGEDAAQRQAGLESEELGRGEPRRETRSDEPAADRVDGRLRVQLQRHRRKPPHRRTEDALLEPGDLLLPRISACAPVCGCSPHRRLATALRIGRDLTGYESGDPEGENSEKKHQQHLSITP
jgi:hypothetical protein